MIIKGHSPQQILTLFGFKGVKGVSESQRASYRRTFGFTDTNRDGKHSRKEYVENGRYMTPQARAGIFQASDSIVVTIPLTEEIRIESRAIVRWVQERAMGVEFVPGLEGGVLTLLSRWVFQRREEDKARFEASAPVAVPSGETPRGIVLVSASQALEDTLRDLLAGLPPFSRVGFSMQTVKEAVAARPALAAPPSAPPSAGDSPGSRRMRSTQSSVSVARHIGSSHLACSSCSSSTSHSLPTFHASRSSFILAKTFAWDRARDALPPGDASHSLFVALPRADVA